MYSSVKILYLLFSLSLHPEALQPVTKSVQLIKRLAQCWTQGHHVLVVLPDNTQKNKLQPTYRPAQSCFHTHSHIYLCVCENSLGLYRQKIIAPSRAASGSPSSCPQKGNDLGVAFPTSSILLPHILIYHSSNDLLSITLAVIPPYRRWYSTFTLNLQYVTCCQNSPGICGRLNLES